MDDINIDDYLKKLNINLDDFSTQQPTTTQSTKINKTDAVLKDIPVTQSQHIEDIYSSGDENSKGAIDLPSPHLRSEVDKILDTLNM